MASVSVNPSPASPGDALSKPPSKTLYPYPLLTISPAALISVHSLLYGRTPRHGVDEGWEGANLQDTHKAVPPILQCTREAVLRLSLIHI